MRASLAFLLPLLLLGACDEKKETPASAPASATQQSSARDAATAALRERLRGQETQLRGMQVFSQALADTVAVCGRSSGGAGDPYIPFVAVVSFQGEGARVTNFTLGATGPEATRVFLEMVDRCFDGGGPLTNRAMARSYPPLPITGASDPIAAPPPAVSPGPVPDPAAQPAAPAAPPTPLQAGSLPASRSTVVTWARTGANLRSNPVGGEVIGVLPPSTTLDVIAEAPGGWYQVGRDGNAIGWIHSSVLEAPGH
ncbi:SH3 domain-containing protein [Roseococcus pinisoli]|uniref:SH3 domain-containing protein n=1 Tax=Roseococcus pinisoli TaxID=2835040 RepID=A0ABS5QBQ2_9PROT|nr:SH3 domain-containing protein [Roseococcus pinisoli]